MKNLTRYILITNQGERRTWAHSRAEARLKYETRTCRVYTVIEDPRYIKLTDKNENR